MVKTFVRLSVVAVAAASVVGCAEMSSIADKIGVHMPDLGNRAEYESSASRAPLDIPPDLDVLVRNDRFTVPARTQIVSANAEDAKVRLEAERRGDQPSMVMPQTVFAKVVREGQVRYVHVNVSAEKVWPVLQDFWPSVGLSVKKQDARTGVMLTEWAENKANLPKDIIRASVGKLFDFVYDTGERDQYRARLERNEDGSSNIYITHRQMIEVLKGKNEESTVWQPGPSDPQLEAEMLTRLAQALEYEFNPDMKPAEQKAVEEMAAQKYVPMSDIVTDQAGIAREVIINEPFDRAWRRLGLGLDRAGFDIIDRDRSQGIVVIKYLDKDYEASEKSKQGIFANAFGQTRPIDPVQYQIRLVPEGEKSHLYVTGAGGREDTTGIAPQIVTIIADQVR